MYWNWKEVLENDRKLGIATLGFVMREGRHREIG